MSSIVSNQACWQNEARVKVSFGPVQTNTPGPGEILVQNEYFGTSPVDWQDQKVTIHAKSFPTILGTSFAGTVQSVGSDVTTFQPKDIVAVNRSDKTLNYARYGIFQKCVVASTKTTAKVIPNASLPSAAATFINLATAYSALSFYMKLTKPPLSGAPSPENKDKQILIYGGSSSCGG